MLAIVLVAGLAHSDGSGAASSSSERSSVVDGSTSTTSTVAGVVIATDPTLPKTQLTNALRLGSAGAQVSALQQRLTDLGFAPGPIDGQFGSGTQQAVWAFEKLVLKTPRAQATGKVTNDMWQTMQDDLTISPERPTGVGTTHVEIYVPSQVLIVFTDDHPKLIAHVSTGEENPDGTPYHWCANVTYDTGPNGEPLDTPQKQYVCADAKTPGGIFKFNRRYSGNRVGPLGGMFNPVYFNYGIAIHGAQNVPLEPASHGCVRLNETIAKFFPDLVSNGDGVYVWGEDGRQPEQYSKNDSLPSFNQNSVDPNATTTTSSTTSTTVRPTTTTPTTPAPTTARPTPTTKPAPATTTVASPATTTTASPAA
ncbi:MAG: L,D-transpeptidase family protein [Ilumatobacteraceae bacterium]